MKGVGMKKSVIVFIILAITAAPVINYAQAGDVCHQAQRDAKRDVELNRRFDRIEEKLEPLPAMCGKIDRNERDIQDNRDELKAINRRSNWIDVINAAWTAIATAVVSALK